MKDQIKKAFDLAENEVEEKAIENLKKIIKNILETKKKKETERDELDEDIKILKQDIDDFKAGRLDKIKERHDTVEKADKVAPINITIIQDNSRKIYPTQPWKWNYEVYWGYYPNYSITAGGTNTMYLNTALCANINGFGFSTTGATAANFTSGTYQVGNGIINL